MAQPNKWWSTTEWLTPASILQSQTSRLKHFAKAGENFALRDRSKIGALQYRNHATERLLLPEGHLIYQAIYSV